MMPDSDGAIVLLRRRAAELTKKAEQLNRVATILERHSDNPSLSHGSALETMIAECVMEYSRR